MFLMHIPPCRGIKSLILAIIAMSIAGCANLQSGSEPPVDAVVTIPLEQDNAQIEASSLQHQNFIDFVEVTIHRKSDHDPVEDGLDIESETNALAVDRSVVVFAKHAHMSKREREEAQVIAEIEETLLEIRRSNNAWYRLQQGMQLIPVDNKRVRAQLKWYLEHPGYMQRVMERARPILPFVLDELERRNLPSEIALLPIVESAYQAFAYSHGRASGMWQIIPSTGRFLGLKQNWWYDGRRDIIESTHAAINYLESLAGQFDGDWELALASYNAGPGRIRGAVRYNKKRNRQTDFWHLTKFRKETRDYVPKMFALRELFANPEKYQLDLVPVGNQMNYEIVELDGQIDLALAAELAGISVNELYQLNPAFNRWATAPEGPHRLLLPLGKARQFKLAVSQVPPNERINWVRHKIKNGETLGHISRKYGTTIALIREVNNIRGTQIRAGKYLMVPTATRTLQSYTMSQQSRTNKIQNTNRSGSKQVHIVRSGQSLWSISRNYGVSTRALAKWNGIAPIDTLRVGQKLVIWTKDTNAQKVSINQTRPNNVLHALRYTVRKGDSLYLIANRFNIKVADIKRWNRIGKYLQPGQKLKLYVDITSQSG
jgi:membrane-bound lytic murein transglycosylase D